MNEIQRTYYLDFLRIFATIAVIVLHTAASNWSKSAIATDNWVSFNFWDSIVRWAVPVFVMISGALFLGTPRSEDIGRIYKKYIFRICIAFLFWSFVYAMKTRIENPDIAIQDSIVEFIHGHYHMWYLLMITALYAVTPLINQIVKNMRYAKYFLVISICFASIIPSLQTLFNLITANNIYKVISPERIGVVIDALSEDINKMNMHLVMGYTLYYILGYYIYHAEISKRKEIAIYIISLIGFACTIILSNYGAIKTGSPYQEFYGYFQFNVFLESLGIFVFFKQRVSHVQVKHDKVLRKISKYTFGAYLVHALVLEELRQFGIETTSFNVFLSVPIISIIVFLISLAISFILNKIPIVNKYLV